MPDVVPPCPNQPVITTHSRRFYQIELITPMFGGGAEVRECDPDFPIRPTAIRRQLQFWWRATVGVQYATTAELSKAQSEIWGSTYCSSQVTVRVENVKADKPSPCAKTYHNNSGKNLPRFGGHCNIYPTQRPIVSYCCHLPHSYILGA